MGGANSKLFLQESVKKEKTPLILTYVKDTLDAIKTSSSGGDISTLKSAVKNAEEALKTAELNKASKTAARDAKIAEANNKLSELKTTINKFYDLHKNEFNKEYDATGKTIKMPTDATKVAMVIAYSMSDIINIDINNIRSIDPSIDAISKLNHIRKDLEVSREVARTTGIPTAKPGESGGSSLVANAQIQNLVEFKKQPGLIPTIKTIINSITPPFVEKTIDDQFVLYMKPDEIIPKIDELVKVIQNIPPPVDAEIATKTNALRTAQETLNKAESSERLPQLIKNLDDISWTIPELEPLKLKLKEPQTTTSKTTSAPVAPPPPGAPVAPAPVAPAPVAPAPVAPAPVAPAPVAPAPIVPFGKNVDIMKIINDPSVDKTIKDQVKTLWNSRLTDPQWSGKLRNLIIDKLPSRLSDFFTNNKLNKITKPLTGGARTSRRNRKTPERQSYRRPRSRGNATRKNHRPRKGE